MNPRPRLPLRADARPVPRSPGTAPVAHRARTPLVPLLCTVALTAATALAALLRSLLPPETATGPFAPDAGSPR